MNFDPKHKGSQPEAQSLAFLDWEGFKDRVLACFIPNLNGDAKDSAWAEVKHIAMAYMTNIERSRTPLPFTITYACQFKDGHSFEVTYPPKIGRGRPCDNIAARVVFDLKNLLIKYHRRHGVSHQERQKYGSPLESLAKLVHEMVGEASRGGWLHMAEMANTDFRTTKNRKAVRWWWNFERGRGNPGRTLTLDEARMLDCIFSIYELGTPEMVDPLLK